MTKPRILLVYGGESSEHDVSLKSAANIYKAIDKKKYDIRLAYIDTAGRWWLQSKWQDDPSDIDKVQLVAAPGTGYFLTVPGSKAIHIDVIFPVLHGKNGEDGTIQGLASMVHAKVVGPSVINASISMDKDVTKHILRDAKIPVVDWALWHTSDEKPTYKDLVRKLGKVMFVKPANAGSSIGVSKVRSSEEFDKGMRLAAKHDNLVLIEKAIKGIEVQVSILGNGKPIATEICEIESTTDFHDFEDKYSSNSTARFHVPARLTAKQSERIKHYAVDAYKAVRGQGLARVDFFVVDKKTEYLNEINAIPGFTDVSVYPMLWREAGVPTTTLIDRLITLALE